MTDKTKSIRELFEDSLVDILHGRVVTGKDGEPIVTEDGRVAVVRPAAPDLAVVRAYLKDQEKPSDPKIPQTGEPVGALAQYLRQSGKSLPFAPKTAQ